MVGKGYLRIDISKSRNDTPKIYKRLMQDCVQYDWNNRPLFPQVGTVSTRTNTITRTCLQPLTFNTNSNTNSTITRTCLQPLSFNTNSNTNSTITRTCLQPLSFNTNSNTNSTITRTCLQPLSFKTAILVTP